MLHSFFNFYIIWCISEPLNFSIKQQKLMDKFYITFSVQRKFVLDAVTGYYLKNPLKL